MKSKGSVTNYAFSQKNNWRKQVHKEIEKRIKASPIRMQDAKVLYLAGMDDLDRKLMTQWRDFRDDNLWIVERDPKVAAKLKSEGKNVQCCEVNDFLMAWNEQFDVIIADFCAGINLNAQAFSSMMVQTAKLSENGVLVVNLLRGRDSDFTEPRQCFQNKDFHVLFENPGVHRGRHFFASMVLYGWTKSHSDWPKISPEGELSDWEAYLEAINNVEMVKSYKAKTEEKCKPRYLSYTSENGVQKMDSVIMNSFPSEKLPVNQNFVIKAFRGNPPGQTYEEAEQRMEEVIRPLRRSIAAQKAHITMRRKNKK